MPWVWSTAVALEVAVAEIEYGDSFTPQLTFVIDIRLPASFSKVPRLECISILPSTVGTPINLLAIPPSTASSPIVAAALVLTYGPARLASTPQQLDSAF
jgi:hypothetical protein